jgi:anti-sigma factor RsiW
MSTKPTEHWTDRLSDYLDGELDREQRAACESHLAGCAECSRLLEELRVVVARAGALPQLPLERDLWQEIEPRLRGRILGLPSPSEWRERFARRFSFSGGQLAAAAAALMVVSGGLAWMIASRGTVATRGVATGPVAVAPSTSLIPGAGSSAPSSTAVAPSAPVTALPPAQRLTQGEAPAVAADFGVARYDATINELQAALQASRSRLDPHTVQIVEQNLALIDKAIADARAALAADPASPYLNAHLASTMRRKVALLRRVNSLAQI